MEISRKSGKYIVISFYSDIVGKYELRLFRDNDCCDCYLKRDEHPMIHMFGLPLCHTIGEVIDICNANLLEYWEG